MLRMTAIALAAVATVGIASLAPPPRPKPAGRVIIITATGMVIATSARSIMAAGAACGSTPTTAASGNASTSATDLVQFRRSCREAESPGSRKGPGLLFFDCALKQVWSAATFN